MFPLQMISANGTAYRPPERVGTARWWPTIHGHVARALMMVEVMRWVRSFQLWLILSRASV